MMGMSTMKPKQIIIYGLLSFLIASSLAMYVYLNHQLHDHTHTPSSNTPNLRIENLYDLQQLKMDGA